MPRNKATNGKQTKLPTKFRPGIIEELDGRTNIAQALRANRDEVLADLGGPLSTIKRMLVDRLVFQNAICENLEYAIATGEGDFDTLAGKLTQANNALKGLARELGPEQQGGKPWIEAETVPR